MLGMIDMPTLLGAALGVATSCLFILLANFVQVPGSRRYRRRVQAIAELKQSGGRTKNRAETRSLTKRGSATPWLDSLFKGWLPRRERLVNRLARTGREITIAHYILATAGAITIATLFCLFFFGLSLGVGLLIGITVGIGLPHWVIGSLGKRRVAAFIALFPEAIDLMVRALRSGLPISEAIINAGQEIGDPVGAEFRTIEAGMRLGRDLEGLLWEIGKRIDAPEFRFFIIALGVQRETGGNLAETLNNLADLLRRRRSMRAKARAMSSEARASMMILGSLPVVVTGILYMTSPNYIRTLFIDPRGIVLVGIALGMLGTGVLVMTRMAKFDI